MAHQPGTKQRCPIAGSICPWAVNGHQPLPAGYQYYRNGLHCKTITSKKVLLSGLLYTLGRMVSYTVLGALIYFGISQFQIAKLFQGNGEKYIGPLMIIIGLIMLGIIKLNFLSKGNITEKLSEKFKNKGLLGSFLLGLVFALAFCPYSGALFFAILMPMTLSASEGLALPVVFSLGTGLPVMLFSFVIAFSIHKLGVYFRAVQKQRR